MDILGSLYSSLDEYLAESNRNTRKIEELKSEIKNLKEKNITISNEIKYAIEMIKIKDPTFDIGKYIPKNKINNDKKTDLLSDIQNELLSLKKEFNSMKNINRFSTKKLNSKIDFYNDKCFICHDKKIYDMTTMDIIDNIDPINSLISIKTSKMIKGVDFNEQDPCSIIIGNNKITFVFYGAHILENQEHQSCMIYYNSLFVCEMTKCRYPKQYNYCVLPGNKLYIENWHEKKYEEKTEITSIIFNFN